MDYESKLETIRGLRRSVLNVRGESILGECETGKYVENRAAFEVYDESTRNEIMEHNRKLVIEVERTSKEEAKKKQTELALHELYKIRKTQNMG